MATKTATRAKRRRTAMVPVTTMEELPLLSENERDQLVDTLKESEVRIKAGDYTQYDRKKFKNRLLRIYRGKQR